MIFTRVIVQSYSAIARFYRYIILNRPIKSALLRNQVTWCHTPLNELTMHQAAQHLIGKHDFSSFRAQGCQSKSPCRAMSLSTSRLMLFYIIW
ncbi:MAG: tRNA pseudouridine synthase [Pseudomonadota bacterium]